MDNAKVVEIVDRIEADFRELARITGEKHISAFVLNGSFHLDSWTTEKGQTVLNFYRRGAENE